MMVVVGGTVSAGSIPFLTRSRGRTDTGTRTVCLVDATWFILLLLLLLLLCRHHHRRPGSLGSDRRDKSRRPEKSGSVATHH